MDEVDFMQLIVTHNSPGQRAKKWRVSPKKSLHILGSSKKVDFYLPDLDTPVWLGIEQRDGQWYLLNLGGTLDFIEKKIEGPFSLSYHESNIEFEPLNNYLKWFDTASLSTQEDHNQEQSHYKSTHQNINNTNGPQDSILVLKYENGRCYHSELMPKDHFLNTYPNVTPLGHWQSFSSNQNIQIYYKLTPFDGTLTQEILAAKSAPNKSEQMVQRITFFSIFMAIFMFLILPNDKSVTDVALESLPPQMAQTEVKLKKPKVQRSRSSKSQGPVQAAAQSSQMNRKIAQPQGKIQFSGLNSKSRLASMISKISGHKPVSKNVVIYSNSSLSTPSDNLASVTATKNIDGAQALTGAYNGVSVGTIGNGSKGGGGGNGRALASLSSATSGTGGTSAAQALDDEADIEGGLDPEVISQYIKSHLGEILYCYERALSGNPNLYGKVGVRFIIGASGKVESQRIVSSTLKNAAIENCMTQKIFKWNFPVPSGGTQVVVTYPFLFKNAQ